MWNSGHDAYLESRVLAADPVELVNLLYQACTQAVREARCYLAAGKIAERSREINKACAIVIELATSLDHERGGDISQRLALLYDYIQRRLLQANMQQSDGPLEDVLGLLTTLSEAWAGVRASQEKPVTASPKPERATESAWTGSAAESPRPQTETENRWSQSAPESSTPQPVTSSAWSQTGAENRWSQSAAESAWSQPESPKPQTATERVWSQPTAEIPEAQPAAESAWSQPAVEADDYRLRAFSF